jgi:SulP family sulfate permease
MITSLVAPAFTIALLAAVESLLSAVVADGMTGTRHRSNTELVAQGVANIVSPLFGGIPATGAIARTATNVQNGGRTPVAGITHAAVLLLITVLFGKWAALIPMPALAGLLVTVAWHMSGWRTFLSEFRAPRSDVVVLLLTFSLTVAVDLTVAIEVGMVAAAFLFMRKMAEVTDVSAIENDEDDDAGAIGDAPAARIGALPPGVRVYEINGPFFFGAAEKFKDTVGRVARAPKVLILRMRHVPAIDSTGLNALRDLARRSRKDGTVVLLTEVQQRTKSAIMRSAVAAEIGEPNIYSTLKAALARANDELRLEAEVPRREVQ